MNTTDIQIEDIVIVKKKVCIASIHHDRRFRCTGGFGMTARALGTKIYGTWLVDNEESYICRQDIDWKETEKYRAPATLYAVASYRDDGSRHVSLYAHRTLNKAYAEVADVLGETVTVGIKTYNVVWIDKEG